MGKKANAVAVPESVQQEPMQLEELLSIPDVMRTLNMGRDTVHRLIREEGLPTVKLGNRHKVIPSSLAAWVKQREQSIIKLTAHTTP
jgi:excisionase family DNA binding protein